jgi:hypothetical protein
MNNDMEGCRKLTVVAASGEAGKAEDKNGTERWLFH